MSYFPQPYTNIKSKIGAEIRFIELCKIIWLKNAAVVDASDFTDKADLANLKSEINKLDNGKLKPTPVDLSNLSNVVKAELIKKTVYKESVKKIKTIADYLY